MTIAVIGGGGREHAIIHKLRQSPRCGRLYALPGNGGIAAQAECVPIKATDIDAAVDFCASHEIDYVVVAPDDPLAAGMVDALAERGIPAFGPTRAAARIEASKVFSKGLMKRYGIPTAAYESFTDPDAALAYIEGLGSFPVWIKTDGLALGKGAIACHSLPHAEQILRQVMVERAFGDSGASVVVEENLAGPEVTVLAFCDGKTVVPMVSSTDHKRANDGDTGLNTGGMGTIAPSPFYTGAVAARCMDEIYLPTIKAMAAEGTPFKGCLYFGLMLTPGGPRVIEYNCRFGDPEAQVVLPLLQSDLLEIFLACTEGRLTPDMVRFAPGAAACVVMASGGYPESYQTGHPIAGLDEAAAVPGVTVYHAGTKRAGGEIQTAGGRVLGVSATADGLKEALAAAYRAVGKISFKDAHYRTDIGRGALEAGGN